MQKRWLRHDRTLAALASAATVLLLGPRAGLAGPDLPRATPPHPAAKEAAAEPAGPAAPGADPPLLHPGDEAPRFTALLHNPKEAGAASFDLSALAGPDAEEPGVKLVLLSFFATWCGPCKKELPFLVQLSRTYKARGLRVVSVAIDKDEAKWPQIRDLVELHRIDYPVAKDRTNLIARRWLGEKTALPAVFLVGRDGLVKLVKQGYPKDAAEFLTGEVERELAAVP